MNATHQRDLFADEVIDYLCNQLGIELRTPAHGHQLHRSCGVLRGELHTALARLNPQLDNEARKAALSLITEPQEQPLCERNKQSLEALQEGLTVSYNTDTEQKHTRARLIDYTDTENNHLLLLPSQQSQGEMVTLYVNGLPLILLAFESVAQIHQYKHEHAELMVHNAFCILCTERGIRVGSLTAGEDRYMRWWSSCGEEADDCKVQLSALLNKECLMELLHHFICYTGDHKIVAAPHQFHGVRAALASTQRAHEGEGRAGVFWHTQGSGKSLSMIFYARQILLNDALNTPTIVVVTDRQELDQQLMQQFKLCAGLLGTIPVKARSRQHLRELLRSRRAGGIILTTLQKFSISAHDHEHALSQRRNIIVIADEAHRSHYGLLEQVNRKGQVSVGAARKLRLTLPHASFIGFTATPISRRDRSTREVFGDYIDIYDSEQSIRDGITCPIHVESRVSQLNLNEQILKLLDDYYSNTAIDTATSSPPRLQSLLSDTSSVHSLCTDIIAHYEGGRDLAGKALIVAPTRAIAMQIRDRLVSLRPDWHQSSPEQPQAGKIALVMSTQSQDPLSWQQLIGSKTQREELARTFKDNQSPLKLAIVVDMWLTGFDLPSLSTLYLYRPLRDHQLMQALTRVNRVYKGKDAGLIVDYIGIAPALQKARYQYSKGAQQRLLDLNISDDSLQQTRMQLEICDDLLYGYQRTHWMLNDNDVTSIKERSRELAAAATYLREAQGQHAATRVADFLYETKLLRRSSINCTSLLSGVEREKVSFYLALRYELIPISNAENPSPQSSDPLSADLFSLLKQHNSILDQGYYSTSRELTQLYTREHKHLSVRLIEQELIEQLEAYRHLNCLRAEEYEQQLRILMQQYHTRKITPEESINQIRSIISSLQQSQHAGSSLQLSDEEYAFYDALSRCSRALELFAPERLAQITRELTQKLRPNRHQNWKQRETIQARMRCDIKRHLAHYGFPREERAELLRSVMRQCETELPSQSPGI